MMEMRGKKLVLIVFLVCLGATIIGYFLYTSLQLSRQLVEISKRSPRVQKYLYKYPAAQAKISEGKMAKDKIYDCWIATWSNPEGDFLNHSIVVWINKDNLEITEVEEIW